MTDFQIISDLHLEFYKKLPDHICNDYFPKSQTLILAGDIGYPLSLMWRKFIDWCESKFTRIFYVLGNHEFYGVDMSKVTENVKFTFSTKPKFTLLERGVISELGPYKLIGCTLWSEPTPTAYYSMNDSNLLFENGKHVLLEKILELHNDDKKWLEETTDENTIVITHHIPSFELISPQYRTEEYMKINCAYASNCDSIIRKSKAMIYGHTHAPSDVMIEDKYRCVCNPYGYPKEQHKFFKYESFYL
jgi:predicted phosphodiesterase